MEEIIVKKGEFEEKIVELINSSGLPAFIIKPIAKEIYEQCLIQEQNQYEQAKKKIEENKEKEKENGIQQN